MFCYYSLQANPPVGKDNPPDLAALVPSDSIVLPDLPEKAASLQAPAKAHVVSDSKYTEITGTSLAKIWYYHSIICLNKDEDINACVFPLFFS